MDARTAIVDTVTSLFWHTDHHDWDRLAAVFADPVRLDYTAIQGGEPQLLAPADVVAGWRPAFDALDAHQHLVSNSLLHLDGDRAELTASFIATHQWQAETWTLGGDYRMELTRIDMRWRVSGMTMIPVWQTGDPGLIPRAIAAASGSSPR